MIVNVLIIILQGALGVVFFLLPEADLASIPIIGDTIQSTLTTFITYVNGFIDVFPYAEIVWKLFIFGIIPFEIALITLKFFLGSRTPTNY